MVVDIEVDKLSNMVVDLGIDKMAYMVVDNGHGVDKVYKKYICVERLQECKLEIVYSQPPASGSMYPVEEEGRVFPHEEQGQLLEEVANCFVLILARLFGQSSAQLLDLLNCNTMPPT